MLKEIFRLLPPAERRHSVWVALAVLVRAMLDFAGVAALIPLLLAVLRPGSSRGTMLVLCGAVMLFVVVKNGLVVLLGRGWRAASSCAFTATSAGGCSSTTTAGD